MKTIKMRETCKGSQDGTTVQVFKGGATYAICDELADVFLSEKWATIVKEPMVTPESKAEKIETPEKTE